MLYYNKRWWRFNLANKKSMFILNMPTHPKGIEPLSQEPESCVISTTLRMQILIKYTGNLKKNKGELDEI